MREIGAKAWDRLEGGRSLYQSSRWLTWAESDSAFEPYYLMARDEQSRLVGALPSYFCRGEAAAVNPWYDPVKVFVDPHVEVTAGGDRWFPLLLLGSRSGYHGDVLVDPRLHEAQRDAVIRRLLGTCKRIAADRGAHSMALMYVSETTAATVSRLADGAGQAVPTSAEAVVSVEWDNFDDYLLQFNRQRRTNIRREIKTFEAADVVVRLTTLGQSFDRLGPLLGRLQRKYGSAVTDEEMTKRLEAQAAALDGISKVFLEMRDGQVVGFSLCYEWRGVLYLRATGFNTEAGSARFAYFNLAVYWPLRYAIEHRLHGVNLGVSAYQGKVLRGAQLVPSWSVVWPPCDANPAWLAALEQSAAEATEAEGVVPGTFGRDLPSGLPSRWRASLA